MIKLCTLTTVPVTIKAFLGDQLSFLQKNGFDVTIITSSLDASQDFGKSLPKDIKIKYVALTRTIQPLTDLKALRDIIKILRHGKFDIVQYVTPKGALLGAIASQVTRVPVRLYLMWGLYYVTQRGLKRIFFRALEKSICVLSTSIAPDSKGNKNLAVSERLCTLKKIEVVGNGSANGVDVERFNPNRLKDCRKDLRNRCRIPQDAFVFGTIAAIVADKGINELISAFQKVAQSHQSVYLLYIGLTTEKNHVTTYTLDTIQNHKRIIHMGWQDEPEKFLAAMDVFVLPTYREGFGVVNIEASAMELPVITTDVPGPQESVAHRQTGILVPAKTIDPLIEAMEELIKNPDLAKRLGKFGRKRVMEHYEQKQFWWNMLKHRRKLLKTSDSLLYREPLP